MASDTFYVRSSERIAKLTRRSRRIIISAPKSKGQSANLSGINRVHVQCHVMDEAETSDHGFSEEES